MDCHPLEVGGRTTPAAVPQTFREAADGCAPLISYPNGTLPSGKAFVSAPDEVDSAFSANYAAKIAPEFVTGKACCDLVSTRANERKSRPGLKRTGLNGVQVTPSQQTWAASLKLASQPQAGRGASLQITLCGSKSYEAEIQRPAAVQPQGVLHTGLRKIRRLSNGKLWNLGYVSEHNSKPRF